jgi:hypothetical protein
MAGKSLPELQAIAKQYSGPFRELFGTGKAGAELVLKNIEKVKIPEGLTREALEAYSELIKHVKDPTGTQEVRAEILDYLLK